MNRKIKELIIERDELRKEVRGKSVSSWKFWENKKDKKLLRNMQRICDINNILSGVRLLKENADHDKNAEGEKDE